MAITELLVCGPGAELRAGGVQNRLRPLVWDVSWGTGFPSISAGQVAVEQTGMSYSCTLSPPTSSSGVRGCRGLGVGLEVDDLRSRVFISFHCILL